MTSGCIPYLLNPGQKHRQNNGGPSERRFRLRLLLWSWKKWRSFSESIFLSTNTYPLRILAIIHPFWLCFLSFSNTFPGKIDFNKRYRFSFLITCFKNSSFRILNVFTTSFSWFILLRTSLVMQFFRICLQPQLKCF